MQLGLGPPPRTNSSRASSHGVKVFGAGWLTQVGRFGAGKRLGRCGAVSRPPNTLGTVVITLRVMVSEPPAPHHAERDDYGPPSGVGSTGRAGMMEKREQIEKCSRLSRLRLEMPRLS